MRKFYLAPFYIPLLASGQECNSTDGHNFYIGGQWVRPADPAVPPIVVIDPSTGARATSVNAGGAADVDAAVAAARRSFPGWSGVTPAVRRDHISRLRDAYVGRQEEMARAISTEMGAPIDFALESQVGAGLYHIDNFLAALESFEFPRAGGGGATTILMEPVGVAALITPWNWPMNQVVLKVVAALAVGCTCVLKPSEAAPLSSLLFAEMVHDAGFPPGAFNLVTGGGGDGGAGELLAAHPDVDMVSFTGSTRAGAAVSRAGADTFKKISLELGGKGAAVVFADVGDDLEEYVTQVVERCFENTGQSCDAPTRLLVERDVYHRAVEIAQGVALAHAVGSAHAPGDHLGPVVNSAQFDTIQKYILSGVEEGGRLVAGGPGRPKGTDAAGFYVRPTVFADVNNDMKIMREEIFGPVLGMMPFDSEEEALEIANDTPYGLTNYVYSGSPERCRRMARALRSGMVEMNGVGIDGAAPFGGMKASGHGREGGVYGLEEFCHVKAVSGWED